MRGSIFSRRHASLLLLLVLATTGLACGRNRVVLDVDARSFMDQSQMVNPYIVPPLVPFTIRLDSIPVNLVEGFSDFGAAEAATIGLGILYDNATGTGTARFRLYFSDDLSTLFATPPVTVIDASLVAATITTASARIDADQRLLDLFTAKQFWMGIDMQWEATTLEPMQGTCTIAEINVHLVSTLELFQ